MQEFLLKSEGVTDAVQMYGTVPLVELLRPQASSRSDRERNLKSEKSNVRVVPSFVAWLCKAVPVPVSAANGAKTLVVLLVEDEFFVRYDIATCLREAGYVVVESGSGEDAMVVCSKSATVIDMVLTDINLGGSISGWDVADYFRMELAEIPVLYMSGGYD